MLTRFDRDGVELVINTSTGESFATIRGYARMSGLEASAISKRLTRGYKGVDKASLKTAEIQTEGGVQGVSLLSEDIISEWIVDDNAALAKQMLKAGVRAFLHTAAGYEIQAIAPQQQTQIEPLRRDQQLEALKMLFTLNERLPDDRTTITLKAQLTNLVEASQQSEPTPPLLSVTEVCEMHGITIPKGKDSVIGKKVASDWRQSQGSDPLTCAKHVGRGHKTASIKVYPAEFFERIIAIASEYLD